MAKRMQGKRFFCMYYIIIVVCPSGEKPLNCENHVQKPIFSVRNINQENRLPSLNLRV